MILNMVYFVEVQEKRGIRAPGIREGPINTESHYSRYLIPYSQTNSDHLFVFLFFSYKEVNQIRVVKLQVYFGYSCKRVQKFQF